MMDREVIRSEKEFPVLLESRILPYLEERKNEGYFEREADRKIHYVAYSADAPKGIMLVSHGFTEAIPKYQEILYHFVTNGYHTLMIEHCGHGKSYAMTDDPSKVYVDRYERYVKDLLFAAGEAKRRFGEELPLYLYGHSMGGGIAAAALAFEPQLFTRAILSSPMIRPLTGNVPYPLTRIISAVWCLIGKGQDYVFGQKPYAPELDDFKTSAALSEPRFAQFQRLRAADPSYQRWSASFQWLHEAIRLNSYLRGRAIQQYQTPILLFQAGHDAYVSLPEQDHFVDAVNRAHPSSDGNPALVRMIRYPDSRHEIFLATPKMREEYWDQIFDFLEEK